MREPGYVEVTGGWNVISGGVSEVIGELTSKEPVDIGRCWHQEFSHVAVRLQEEFVAKYQNRILRCTERFEEHSGSGCESYAPGRLQRVGCQRVLRSPAKRGGSILHASMGWRRVSCHDMRRGGPHRGRNDGRAQAQPSGPPRTSATWSLTFPATRKT